MTVLKVALHRWPRPRMRTAVADNRRTLLDSIYEIKRHASVGALSDPCGSRLSRMWTPRTSSSG